MADENTNVDTEESFMDEETENQELNSGLSVGNKNYVHPPKGWREKAAELAVGERNEGQNEERNDEKNKDLAAWVRRNNASEIKQQDAENTITSASTKKSAEVNSAEVTAEEKQNSGTVNSESVSENEETDEKEVEPVIVSGTNISLSNDPGSDYARKLGFNASILSDTEDINDVSGISLVRFSDENEVEHNGAYRITYDFTSGDTVNRLFASYKVGTEKSANENQQDNQKSDDGKINSAIEADKNKSDKKSVKENKAENKNVNQDIDKAASDEKDSKEINGVSAENKDAVNDDEKGIKVPVQSDILVNMEQLQKYLRSAAAGTPDEYFKVDPEVKTFSFSLCGAEGVYDSKNDKFLKLAINKELVTEEDLKKYSGTQLFNMVPMGSMLGDTSEKPVTSEVLTEMSSRDKIIASCKDEKLQELLKDINSSCRKMTKLSRSYAGARNQLDDLNFSNHKASVPARAWNRIAGRFNLYSDSEAQKMEGKGFTKRLLYKAMKPSIMSRNEKMVQPSEYMEQFDAKMAEQYKVFKEQYDKLQNIVNSIPGEVAVNYSKELSRLSEGMKCFREWEEYRNSSAFDAKSSAAIKNYAECMTHNCKLISKDLTICAGKLNHVYHESCNCCYDNQIKKLYLQEKINGCNVKAGFAAPAIDCYRFYAKTASKDEIEFKGSLDAVAVDKMIVLNKGRDEIIDALLKASPNLSGQSEEVVGKFVDSRLDFVNGVKSENREENFSRNSRGRKTAEFTNDSGSPKDTHGKAHGGHRDKGNRDR